MRPGIKSRLERLEEAGGLKAKPLIVATVGATGGPLTGVRVHGKTIRRPVNESEEAFKHRAANEQRRPGEIVLYLHEIRDKV